MIVIRQNLATGTLGKATCGTLGVARGWGLSKGFFEGEWCARMGAVEGRVFLDREGLYREKKTSHVSEWYICERQQASFFEKDGD